MTIVALLFQSSLIARFSSTKKRSRRSTVKVARNAYICIILYSQPADVQKIKCKHCAAYVTSPFLGSLAQSNMHKHEAASFFRSFMVATASFKNEQIKIISNIKCTL